MNIKPLRDNIVIIPKEADEKTKTDTGIYLPDTASNENEKPQMGEVVAVGDSDDISVSKSDLVIYNKYSGTEVSVDGKEYLIVKNEDILAIVK